MLICPHSGVGNQIGNYVFGQYLAYLGENVKFLFSDDENIDRTFVLNKFNTELPEASKEDIEKFLRAGAGFTLYKNLVKNMALRKKEYFNSFYKVLKRIRTKYGIYPAKTPALMAKTVSYRDVLKCVSKKEILNEAAVCDCYSPVREFYDQNFREKMRKHFTLKEELDEKNKAVFDEIKGCKNSVGIHIRRGDCIKLKIPVVKKEFLYDKISYFRQNFPKKENEGKNIESRFFIFSDSIDWAKEHIKGDDIFFVDINDETKGYLDFMLFNACRHRIYSASSFSKWTEYFNPFCDSIEFIPGGGDLIIE